MWLTIFRVDGEMKSTLKKDKKKESDSSDEDDGRDDKAEITTQPEQVGTVYIAEDRAFGLYGFDAQGATNYSAKWSVNWLDQLKGTSNMIS